MIERPIVATELSCRVVIQNCLLILIHLHEEIKIELNSHRRWTMPKFLLSPKIVDVVMEMLRNPTFLIILILILIHFQAVNSPEAMRCRLLKYFIPVLVMSLVFNVPKFLECYVTWETTNSTIIHPHNETANLTVNITVS